jgi:DNA-binding LacI/PurR family transcriptional regulator
LARSITSGHLDVPTDLSVVEYDNIYLSRIRHLSLASVDNGNFAVGAQAANTATFQGRETSG